MLKYKNGDKQLRNCEFAKAYKRNLLSKLKKQTRRPDVMR